MEVQSLDEVKLPFCSTFSRYQEIDGFLPRKSEWSRVKTRVLKKIDHVS